MLEEKSYIFLNRAESFFLKKGVQPLQQKIVFPPERKQVNIRTDISIYRIALLLKIGSSAAGGFATFWLHSFNSASSNLHSWHLKKLPILELTAH